MVVITRDGIIKGGSCDQEHRARASRVAGAKYFRSIMWRLLCLRMTHHRRVRVVNIPKWTFTEWIDLKEGRCDAGYEIGMFRAKQVFEEMLANGTLLTPHRLGQALRQACSYATNAAVMQLLGIRNSQHDEEFVQAPEIYRRRVKRGELKER